MPVKLNSAGGGSVTMDVGSTASNFTQNLPLATTTLVGTDTTQTLTNKTLGSGYGGGAVVRGTAQASTSGTVIDFTGIPSWVRRITVMFYGISTTGNSLILLQLGDAGGIEATGYFGAGVTVDNTPALSRCTFSTTGIPIVVETPSDLNSGVITLVNINGNDWIATGTMVTDSSTADYAGYVSSRKSLSDVLTQVRITTSTGTPTFDAGTINIMYE
jgi:hypothetical protein